MSGYQEVLTDPSYLGQIVTMTSPHQGNYGVNLEDVESDRFRVAGYDFGMKRNILRLLAENGCETIVFPAQTPARAVMDDGFDGVFLSNGPGDPAATTYGVEAVGELVGRIPVFGICLGHQLL